MPHRFHGGAMIRVRGQGGSKRGGAGKEVKSKKITFSPLTNCLNNTLNYLL